MDFTKWIREGIKHPRPAIYLKVISVFMVLGALSHLASILSVAGRPWAAKPLHFQIADLVLLTTNLVLAWGLWRRRLWAVIGWIAAAVFFQAIPILLFTESFAAGPRERTILYTMLATNAILLGVFFALLPRKKGGTPR